MIISGPSSVSPVNMRPYLPRDQTVNFHVNVPSYDISLKMEYLFCRLMYLQINVPRLMYEINVQIKVPTVKFFKNRT